MNDIVLTQDISSGRVHKRFRADKGYATHEADNLDDAGAYKVLTQSEFDELPADVRCKRCFSEDDAAMGQEDPVVA
jgi:hypothetical protein